MKRAGLTACLAVLLMLGSCSSDDTYSTYSKYKASFTYNKVMTAEPLRSALTGLGEFCSITLGTNSVDFKSLTKSYSDPITATEMYYQHFVCINGFIVGKSNMPDMKTYDLVIVCFDLACPNCHRDDAVNRSLTLQEGGFAYCTRCKRKYSLNNGGLVTDGDAGRPLERYHITYDGSNRMVISN